MNTGDWTIKVNNTQELLVKLKTKELAHKLQHQVNSNPLNGKNSLMIPNRIEVIFSIIPNPVEINRHRETLPELQN